MKSILVYDNDCNMCSIFIRFIVHFNKNPYIFITDFKSDWYKHNMPDSQIDSAMFVTGSDVYIYSDAIIYLLASVNIYFRPLILLKFIPKFIRDNVYKLVARNRKKYSRPTHCTIPSKKYIEMYMK